MKIGLMATYPPRRSSLRKMLPTVLPQLDRLYIYCNQYTEYQIDKLIDWIGEQETTCQVVVINPGQDLQDMGKVWKLDELKNVEGYTFLIDDDLLYPEDYTARHIKAIDLHQCVMCVHGRVIRNRPVNHYFHDTESYHYKNPLSKPVEVDIAGTGTVAFKTSHLSDEFYPSPFELNWFKGIADIWFAYQSKKTGLTIKALPRPNKWLSDAPASGISLYEQALEDHERHCRILNQPEFDD